jgi:hypothetical protein
VRSFPAFGIIAADGSVRVFVGTSAATDLLEALEKEHTHAEL